MGSGRHLLLKPGSRPQHQPAHQTLPRSADRSLLAPHLLQIRWLATSDTGMRLGQPQDLGIE